MDPFFHTGLSISDSLKTVRKSVLIYETIIDLTQKNMGEILNCSQRIYSNYECGDVDIPTHILIKLAEFHNTSVDYLLNLTDDKRPYPRKKNSST